MKSTDVIWKQIFQPDCLFLIFHYWTIDKPLLLNSLLEPVDAVLPCDMSNQFLFVGSSMKIDGLAKLETMR